MSRAGTARQAHFGGQCPPYVPTLSLGVMSDASPLGFGFRCRSARDGTHSEYLLTRRPLQRVLAFRGRTIDDIVNSPIVKNEILGFWKLHKQIERSSETVELERQWNRIGT